MDPRPAKRMKLEMEVPAQTCAFRYTATTFPYAKRVQKRGLIMESHSTKRMKMQAVLQDTDTDTDMEMDSDSNSDSSTVNEVPVQTPCNPKQLAMSRQEMIESADCYGVEWINSPGCELHQAVLQGDVAQVSTILRTDAIAVINTLDLNGLTPLMTAALCDSTLEIVKLLCLYGANETLEARNRQTAAEIAFDYSSDVVFDYIYHHNRIRI